MAASGIMDHGVAGSFSNRIAVASTDSAGENIAAGTKTWADTIRMWEHSPGHNANLLLADADIIGVAVAHNKATRYKVFWSMAIGHKVTSSHVRTAGVMLGPGFAVAVPPARVQAAAETANRDAQPDVPPEKPRHRPKADNSPGFLDSVGTALKRATAPISKTGPAASLGMPGAESHGACAAADRALMPGVQIRFPGVDRDLAGRIGGLAP